MARSRRRLTAVCVTLAGCLSCSSMVVGAVASTSVETTATPESLLWTVRQAYGQGDFDSTWAAQTAFLQHPERNEVDFQAFTHCFIGQNCPTFGLMGAFLGKGRSLMGELPHFCPEWQRIHQAMKADPNQDEDSFPELREELIQATFKGSCDDWRTDMLKMLHPQSVPRTPPEPQTVPLALAQAAEGGVKPIIQVQIAGRTAWMLVDTGASYTSFRGEAARRRLLPDDLEIIDWIPVETFLGRQWKRLMRLPSLQVGDAAFQEVLALVSDQSDGTTLGMSILMRYRSVCFVWSERRLHLGDLGPCALGAQPRSAFISPKFLLELEVPAQDAPPAEPPDRPWRLSPQADAKREWNQDPSLVRVLVDTGSPFNECTSVFVAALGGARQFEFGGGLAADCFPELDRLVITISEENLRRGIGAYTATLGMHGLLQFDAFGWERDPLKLYFVPKAADANAPESP